MPHPRPQRNDADAYWPWQPLAPLLAHLAALLSEAAHLMEWPLAHLLACTLGDLPYRRNSPLGMLFWSKQISVHVHVVPELQMAVTKHKMTS